MSSRLRDDRDFIFILYSDDIDVIEPTEDVTLEEKTAIPGFSRDAVVGEPVNTGSKAWRRLSR